MYHAARFDPSSTYDQTFTIKVNFGKAYLICCFKYKTDNELEFTLRTGASKQNDAWFVGSGYTSASNENILFFNYEFMKAQYAFIYSPKSLVAEFHLYEIQFFGI